MLQQVNNYHKMPYSNWGDYPALVNHERTGMQLEHW